MLKLMCRDIGSMLISSLASSNEPNNTLIQLRLYPKGGSILWGCRSTDHGLMYLPGVFRPCPHKDVHDIYKYSGRLIQLKLILGTRFSLDKDL
jgi:hypothetical protein